ncbi:hypothetical protein, partial [Azohydromonas lata]
ESTIADADGMGTLRYSWWSSADGQTWTRIEGATGESFTLTGAQADRMVRVEVSYVDGHGTTETVKSLATAKLPPIPV